MNYAQCGNESMGFSWVACQLKKNTIARDGLDGPDAKKRMERNEQMDKQVCSSSDLYSLRCVKCERVKEG